MNSLSKPRRTALFLAAFATSTAFALAAPTDLSVRDPSTIIQRDGVYYVYGTGTGTQQFSSRDRLHWTPLGPALAQTPAWLRAAVPDNHDNTVWAPDIIFFGGQYHLYSSYSAWGSKRSAISLATNKTLDPKGWVDQGIVVQSNETSGFNTIDPGVCRDAGGRLWMSFGSYQNGIYLAPLDEGTGKVVAGRALTLIATRPDSPGDTIEASTIYFHDGWYYLFTNWDYCCRGARSNYNIRVCRSRSVTGPFLDKSGKAALQGGGTLFLGAVFDDGSGRPVDDQVGPGHVGILRQGNAYTLSTHYEWSRLFRGQTTVNVQPLTWDADGWPRAVLDAGPWKIVSNLGSHAIVEASGTSAQTASYEAQAAQKWTLRHLGDGFYCAQGAASGLALGTLGGASEPGTKIQLAPFQNLPSQRWFLRQNEDGTYTLLLQAGGQKVALDVTGAALSDQTPLEVWTDNANNAQKWSFRTR